MSLLTTNETAALIGKSKSWLDHARQTGDGPKYLKIGWEVRYRVEDVDAWLATKVRTKVWEETQVP